MEVAGFDCNPSIGIKVDGPDREVMFHLCLGLGLYVTLPLPERFVPRYESSYTPGTRLPDEREVCVSFHDWSLWWSFWMKWGEWNSTDSRWRRGSFHLDDLLFGKHTCKFTPTDVERHLVSFVEGSYEVTVTRKIREDIWPRWFTKRSVSYEVQAEPKPIPREGKGENSWDCGETYTSSSSFPARDIKDCHGAAVYFEARMKEERRRYGGPRWKPKASEIVMA